MSFWKRKDSPLIPPVAEESSRGNSASPRPSYRSAGDSYNRSRDGPDPYSTPSSRLGSAAPPDRYNRNGPVGDPSSRGQATVDRDRSELFAGLDPQRAGGRNRFMDGPDLGKEPTPGEEDEEDIEGIKQQTKFVKQESVNSTRNALRLAREAEETAMGTLNKLGDQSEKFANIERHLDVSKGHALRAKDKTDELKQLNRSIFRPVIVFNKDAKRAAQEAKLEQRYEDQRLDREKAMTEVRETHNRLGRAATYGRGGGDDDEEGIEGAGGRGRFRTAEQLNQRKEQRKRYQFEATGSDDELEDELDDNMDEIMDVTKRLKALGSAMGQELDSQNKRIDVIAGKTDKVDNMLHHNTQRFKKY